MVEATEKSREMHAFSVHALLQSWGNIAIGAISVSMSRLNDISAFVSHAENGGIINDINKDAVSVARLADFVVLGIIVIDAVLMVIFLFTVTLFTVTVRESSVERVIVEGVFRSQDVAESC